VLIRVVDADGSPVAGANVSIGDSPWPRGATQASGVAADAEAQEAFTGFTGAWALKMGGPEVMAAVLDGFSSLSPAGETDALGLVSIERTGESTVVCAAKADIGSSGLVTLGADAGDPAHPLTLVLRPRGLIRGAVSSFSSSARPDLVLFMPEPPASGPRPRQPQAARPDEAGAFTIEVDAPCRGPFFVHTGDRWERLGESEVKPGETAQVGLILRRSVQLQGMVVDESGHPMTSGVVRGFPWWVHLGRSADIGQDGSFSLEVPPGDTAFSVEAIGLGFMSEAAVPIPADAREGPVTLVVSTLVSIRGRVVDAEGRPVEGVAEGRFAFGSLVPRCPYRIIAGSDDERRAEARMVLPGTVDLVLTLPSQK
jgi:hypothetical protein